MFGENKPESRDYDQIVSKERMQAVTKNLVKYIHSLGIKKYRDAERCFVAEGPKVVSDLLPLVSCRTLYATPDYLQQLPDAAAERVGQVVQVSQGELERLSLQRAPRGALAVFEMPVGLETDGCLTHLPAVSLCLALDGVQDPGNLGTILRVADWFGIEHVFASPDTADVYAPKVVQATMGAIGRVKVHYLPLPDFLSRLDPEAPVYGTFLDGTDIYREKLSPNGLIVMGNEGKGISDGVSAFVTQRLLIPNYPEGRPTSESLNVAVATAIVCARFRQL